MYYYAPAALSESGLFQQYIFQHKKKDLAKKWRITKIKDLSSQKGYTLNLKL